MAINLKSAYRINLKQQAYEKNHLFIANGAHASFGGCSDDENEAYEGTYQLTVASEKRMVLVYPPTGGKDKVLKSCLMTKCKEIFDIDYWYPFIHPILGFEYEEGYEYVINVKHYLDGNGFYYELSKIISKTKTDSTGLPENETTDN